MESLPDRPPPDRRRVDRRPVATADAGRALVEMPFRLGFAVTGVVLSAAESAVAIARITAGSVQNEIALAVGVDADELGDDQWELQRQITRVFDPQGILNPGKVFTP